jgi:hypothetical protein
MVSQRLPNLASAFYQSLLSEFIVGRQKSQQVRLREGISEYAG